MVSTVDTNTLVNERGDESEQPRASCKTNLTHAENISQDRSHEATKKRTKGKRDQAEDLLSR